MLVYSSVSQTGLRETKMRDGGRALLAVLNMYVRIKIREVTFDVPSTCQLAVS